MTLPTYRRTYGPFVTLYRCSGGTETELGCWFGSTAHASADACQQEDVLRLCGTTNASRKSTTDMKTTTANKVRFNHHHVCHEQKSEDNFLTGKTRIICSGESATVVLREPARGKRFGTPRVLVQMDQDGFYSWTDADLITRTA